MDTKIFDSLQTDWNGATAVVWSYSTSFSTLQLKLSTKREHIFLVFGGCTRATFDSPWTFSGFSVKKTSDKNIEIKAQENFSIDCLSVSSSKTFRSNELQQTPDTLNSSLEKGTIKKTSSLQKLTQTLQEWHGANVEVWAYEIEPSILDILLSKPDKKEPNSILLSLGICHCVHFESGWQHSNLRIECLEENEQSFNITDGERLSVACKKIGLSSPFDTYKALSRRRHLMNLSDMVDIETVMP